MHLVKEKFDALEAPVKLAVRYAEVYALDVEKAHEELDEANSQVTRLNGQCERDRSRSPIGAYERRRR